MARALLSILGPGGAVLLAGLAGCQLLFPVRAEREDGAPADAAADRAAEAAADATADAVADSGVTDAEAGSTVVVEAPDGDVVRCVAANDSTLYWADQTARTLMESAFDGTGATVLLMAVDVSEMFLAGSESKLYYVGTYGVATGLHVLDLDAGTNQFLSSNIAGCVWFTSAAGYGANVTSNIVYRIDPATGATTQLLGPAQGVVQPWGIAADDSYLYWTEQDPMITGSVLRQPLDGGSDAQTVSLATQQSRPQCLTPDGTGLLYWANYDDGTVRRMQVDGGGQTVIAAHQTKTTQVAVTTQFLFWNSANQVVRTSR